MKRGVGSFAAFEARGARGLVGDREAFEVPRGMRPGRRGASHAVFAALAARPRARLVLHELDAFTGAAFAIAGERNELWLVELAGRARRVPELREGTMVLDDARRGARWAPLRRAHLLAFGILRVPVSQLDDDATRALARAWCRPESPAHRGKR